MKVKVYLAILANQFKLGGTPSVLFKNPFTYLTYSSDELFVDERYVELPDCYEIAETEMREMALFKDDKACRVLLSDDKENIRVLDPDADDSDGLGWKEFKLIPEDEI